MIQGWARDLKENPREDMPGAQPCDEYMVWWRKRLESEVNERRTRLALAKEGGRKYQRQPAEPRADRRR